MIYSWLNGACHYGYWLKSTTYGGCKRITNPEVIKFAKEFENNPFTPTVGI